MAIATFSRKRFEKEITKITPEIEEKINLFGTPIENLTENEISIEIFPNRPDLFSFEGFKRSFLSFLGKEYKKKYEVKKSNYLVYIDENVKDIRPYTVCAVVKNIKFDDEKIKDVIDVQEKLHATIARNRKKAAIGIYPLEKIEFPIRYLAKKPSEIHFVPLDSNTKMYGNEILEQHPTGKAYAPLLKGKKLFPIFIDSANNILSMPPIINSNETGKITEKTKDIFIECSGFNLEVLKKILNILVCMFIDMNGIAYEVKLIYPNKKIITPALKEEKIKININNINKILGLNLKEKEIKKLLKKMNYSYINKEVLIPPYRVDILHEVDIIEDIAIAYGYDNIPPEIPSISTIGKENSREKIKRKISDLLIGLEFIENSSYHLINRELIKKISNEKNENLIEVENSKTDYSILRHSLVPCVIKILSENIKAEYPQKIFEIGKVFNLKNDKINEEERLIVTICSLDSNFTKIKQVLEYICKMLRISFEVEETQNNYFIEGRVGKIVINNKDVGFIGEIHPAILKKFKIKMPTSLFEINLEEIFNIYNP
ncbi:MAG: phenylalanine--tRNA ligase subunit beta [Candidatus Pacearchaeota archaeon]